MNIDKILSRLPGEMRAGVATRAADAIAAFERIAGMSEEDAVLAREAGKINGADLMQVRLAAWQARNFGEPTDSDAVMGMSEELGEIAGAETEEEDVDGFGDLLIFATQLATMNRISISHVSMIGSFAPEDVPAILAIAVGLASHVVLKGRQGIRKLADADTYQVCIYAAIELVTIAVVSRGLVPGNLLRDVGEKVMKRDWKANPVDGSTGEERAS